MQHTDNVGRSGIADEATSVVFCVAGVDNEWLAHLVRKLQLRGESATLGVAR